MANVILKAVLFLMLLLIPSCSSEWYLEDADHEVYDILQEKQEIVMGASRPFSIAKGERVEDLREEARDWYDEDEVPDGGKKPPEDPSGNASDREGRLPPGYEEGDKIYLNLGQALEVAYQLNRSYMDQMEDLYIQGLQLSLQRYLWTPIFQGILSGEIGKGLADQRYRSANANFSMSQLLATGGQISINLATNLLRIYSNPSSDSSSSFLSLNVFQPLWRGSGSLVAQENLTQAERNVAYEVRDFERFRKNLAVSIATSYYGVLRQQDQVQNEKNNYDSLAQNRERSEEMANAGRLPEFQVDQARQDELSARNRWIIARERLDELLDSFKVQLGMPTDVALELDSEDLKKLSEGGLDHPDIDLVKSVHYALNHRLDLLNSRDRVMDARRRVLVAEDGLAGDLDFNFDYELPTEANKPLKFDSREATYSASLDLDLPLDRKSERNSFRQSLIELERQKRTLTLLEDNILQEVRQSHRRLRQALETFEIQKLALELAEKRVESTRILVEAGRADTRDFLESQDALLSAQNSLTAAVVEHTIARLDFLLNIESMEVTNTGQMRTLDLSQ